MAQQVDAYGMPLGCCVWRKQAVVDRQQQELVDAQNELLGVEPQVASINVDMPPATVGELIGEEVEIAVEVVYRINQSDADAVCFVKREWRGEQFDAGESVFRPVQRIETILRHDMEAGPARRPGGGCPRPSGDLSQLRGHKPAVSRRGNVHRTVIAKFTLEARLLEVAKDDLDFKACAPEGNSDHSCQRTLLIA